MRKIPNGTWVAIGLIVGVGLSILYAILGGGEPLIDRDRESATATAVVGPSP